MHPQFLLDWYQFTLLSISYPSTLEKKLSVAQDKASRQLSSLEGAIVGYDALTSDMEDYMEWAVEARDVLATQPRVQGFNVAHAQALLQQQAVSGL